MERRPSTTELIDDILNDAPNAYERLLRSNVNTPKIISDITRSSKKAATMYETCRNNVVYRKIFIYRRIIRKCNKLMSELAKGTISNMVIDGAVVERASKRYINKLADYEDIVPKEVLSSAIDNINREARAVKQSIHEIIREVVTNQSCSLLDCYMMSAYESIAGTKLTSKYNNEIVQRCIYIYNMCLYNLDYDAIHLFAEAERVDGHNDDLIAECLSATKKLRDYAHDLLQAYPQMDRLAKNMYKRADDLDTLVKLHNKFYPPESEIGSDEELE